MVFIDIHRNYLSSWKSNKHICKRPGNEITIKKSEENLLSLSDIRKPRSITFQEQIHTRI